MPTDNVVSSTTDLSTDEPDPPLADIAFLVRSNHRVRVLEELATDERTRRGLHEKPGISQPTLGRVLDGFQEREWVDENGRAYTLTPFLSFSFSSRMVPPSS